MIWSRRILGRPVLGQADFLSALPGLLSATIQAGGAIYGAHMQETIAKMQKQTAQEQQQAAAASAAAPPQNAAQQLTQKTVVTTPTILGINRDVVIIGGVGLALAVGVAAIVTVKSVPVATSALTPSPKKAA